MLTFDEGVTPGGRKISAIFLVVSGLIVGMAAAIMGVGGGFLTFPIFVYGLGCLIHDYCRYRYLPDSLYCRI